MCITVCCTGFKWPEPAASYCRELPEGPYLLGLRKLLMQGHQLERLPPALATARSLEVSS